MLEEMITSEAPDDQEEEVVVQIQSVIQKDKEVF